MPAYITPEITCHLPCSLVSAVGVFFQSLQTDRLQVEWYSAIDSLRLKRIFVHDLGDDLIARVAGKGGLVS